MAGAIVSQVILPSDVAPVFVTGTILLQRVAMMCPSFWVSTCLCCTMASVDSASSSSWFSWGWHVYQSEC